MAQSQVAVLAGGTNMFSIMRAHKERITILDISRIHGLHDITISCREIRIGALVRWADIIRHHLPPDCDGLKAAAKAVGTVQIRNSGTIIGNVCTGMPSASSLPSLVTLSAKLHLRSEKDQRILEIEEFIAERKKGKILTDEIVTALIIPRRAGRVRSAYLKSGLRHGFCPSIAAAAGLLESDDDGRISAIHLAAGTLTAFPRRLRNLETELIGSNSRDEISAAAMSTLQSCQFEACDDGPVLASYQRIAARHLTSRLLSHLARME